MGQHKLKKESRTAAKWVAVISSIIILGIGVYWNLWVYYKKDTAVAYLTSSTAIDNMSVQDLVQEWDKVLAFHSDIGNSAALKWLFYPRLQTLAQQPQPDQAQNVRDALAVLEKYTLPGMTQAAIEAGRVHVILWAKYHSETDYEKAEGFYLQAKFEKPKDPQVLFSLYCLYKARGKDIKEIRTEIVSLYGESEVPTTSCDI